MSGPYVDIYVLSPARSVALAQRFLDEWAPARVPSDDWELPDAAGSFQSFSSLAELLARLEAEPAQDHAIYFRSGRSDEVEHVMLFFTRDGGLIAGASVAVGWEPSPPLVEGLLRRLAETVGARFGCVTFEEAPNAQRSTEFIAECRRRQLALIDGLMVRR